MPKRELWKETPVTEAQNSGLSIPEQFNRIKEFMNTIVQKIENNEYEDKRNSSRE